MKKEQLKRNNRLIKTILVILLSSGLLTGCPFDEPEEKFIFPDPIIKKKAANVLHKSKDCDDFKSYLGQNLIEQYLDNDGGRWGRCPNCFITSPVFDTSEAFGTTAGSGSGGGGSASRVPLTTPSSITGTNNQENGVEELDVIKTDTLGNIFITQDKSLIIADAFPPSELNQLSTLTFNNHLNGLFIDEDNKRLIIFSNHSEEITNSTDIYNSYRYEPIVEISIVDISDLTAPVVLNKYKYNGTYESARLINQRLHVVLNHWLNNIEEKFNTRKFYEDLERYNTLKFLDLESTKKDEAKLRASLAQMILKGVNSLSVKDIFPSFQKDDLEKTALLQCSDIYHPEVSLKSSGILSVVSMDTEGESQTVSSILSSSGIVYSSVNALYIAQSSYGWWQASDEQQTVIHKFALTDTGTNYRASGAVSGIVNNSFSLSEYENNLRVATTETSWPENSNQQISHNNLFILGENDTTSLDILGSFEKFAPDERIYSSRFLDEKGFIVTFRQVDPLFAFDLSDPTNPILKSELKIPGFSTYMHPIGTDHLLTIGRAASDTGRVEETQLQIFDISDMSNVTKTFDHIPDMLKDQNGHGNSIAEYDHHAFTYSEDNNILAIPLSYNNWQTNDSFSGIATFKIDVENGISENGVVDHSDFVSTTECSKEIKANSQVIDATDNGCIEYFYSWYARPNRSIIMSDENGENSYLYSISRLGIKANDLLDMDTELGSLVISPVE